jgi:hypothetical protein
MSGFGRYFVTGWSARFGMWIEEVVECATMEHAKRRFVTQYPTLKQIKVYPLRDK